MSWRISVLNVAQQRAMQRPVQVELRCGAPVKRSRRSTRSAALSMTAFMKRLVKSCRWDLPQWGHLMPTVSRHKRARSAALMGRSISKSFLVLGQHTTARIGVPHPVLTRLSCMRFTALHGALNTWLADRYHADSAALQTSGLANDPKTQLADWGIPLSPAHRIILLEMNAPLQSPGKGPEQQALLRLIGTLVEVPPFA
jgi:hypothetical protein